MEGSFVPGGSKRELCCLCPGYELHYGKAWHRFVDSLLPGVALSWTPADYEAELIARYRKWDKEKP